MTLQQRVRALIEAASAPDFRAADQWAWRHQLEPGEEARNWVARKFRLRRNAMWGAGLVSVLIVTSTDRFLPAAILCLAAWSASDLLAGHVKRKQSAVATLRPKTLNFLVGKSSVAIAVAAVPTLVLAAVGGLWAMTSGERTGEFRRDLPLIIALALVVSLLPLGAAALLARREATAPTAADLDVELTLRRQTLTTLLGFVVALPFIEMGAALHHLLELAVTHSGSRLPAITLGLLSIAAGPGGAFAAVWAFARYRQRCESTAVLERT